MLLRRGFERKSYRAIYQRYPHYQADPFRRTKNARGHSRSLSEHRTARFKLGKGNELFGFLDNVNVPAMNHRAEQAIRPAVVNRKMNGGNRTWRGAYNQAVVTALLRI